MAIKYENDNYSDNDEIKTSTETHEKGGLRTINRDKIEFGNDGPTEIAHE